MGCCDVGVMCDCSQGIDAPGQCAGNIKIPILGKVTSFAYCCGMGTPCVCSQSAGLGADVTECKPMTSSDPCFVAKGPGTHPSAADCEALGAIGCDGKTCQVMGEGTDKAHCMSPMNGETQV